MQKKIKHVQLVVVVCLLSQLISCGSIDTRKKSYSATANQLFDDLYMETVMLQPQRQTILGMKTNYGAWDNYSPEFNDFMHQHYQSQLERLQKLDTSLLDEQALLSYELYAQQLQQEIDDHRWNRHDFPINQMFGLQSRLPAFLINHHRIDTVEDAQAYIQRVNAVPEVFDQLIDELTLSAESGVVAPAFVFPHVLRDCRNILKGISADGVESNPLLDDFQAKLAALDVAPGDKATLQQQLVEALQNSFVPAYKKLMSYAESLSLQAKGNDGVWALPDGEQYYDSRLKRITTTHLSAAEIHQIGLDEVARIHSEMRAIMKRVKFEGDLQDFFRFTREDSQFFYASNQSGREAYLEETHRVLDELRARLDELFFTKPKAELTIKPVEAFREESAGMAFYQRPAPNGSRPGIYYVNLSKMEDMAKYELEALAYHEALPGHHMQIAIAQELEGVPKFRRFGGYTAYIEGWGLYSEFIPSEIGLYADPYSDFGRLSMELWRACRLVVDTGLHYKRWTREQAIEYLNQNTPSSEGSNTKAIERYMVMPGQATAYKIGMMKIQELRDRARRELGESFDIRAYHDEVLANGAVPLDVLEKLIDAWIKSEQKT